MQIIRFAPSNMSYTVDDADQEYICREIYRSLGGSRCVEVCRANPLGTTVVHMEKTVAVASKWINVVFYRVCYSQ